MSRAQLRASYRQLWRLIDTLIAPPSARPAWRQQLHTTFGQEQRVKAEFEGQLLGANAALAKEYVELVNALVHQKELLASYNIGVDRTDEQREAVRSVAARVGLRVPDFPES